MMKNERVPSASSIGETTKRYKNGTRVDVTKISMQFKKYKWQFSERLEKQTKSSVV